MLQSATRVTLLILCYNQQEYIADAIDGAFAQDYPSLEILISDDCSKDDTFDIVKARVSTYRGPHTVRCYRNDHNIGIAEHVNKLNRLASGDLIVVAAGDDISLPERVSRIAAAYASRQARCHYFYSTATHMTVSGELREQVSSPGASAAGSRYKTALSPYPLAIGATQAWTRELVQTFGPLDPDVWAEDQILGFRGRLLGEVCFIDAPLVAYRIGNGISTKKKPFTVKSYFRGKLSGIVIYRQRCKDAATVRAYGLTVVLAMKIAAMTIALPVAPLLSAATKLRRRIR